MVRLIGVPATAWEWELVFCVEMSQVKESERGRRSKRLCVLGLS